MDVNRVVCWGKLCVGTFSDQQSFFSVSSLPFFLFSFFFFSFSPLLSGFPSCKSSRSPFPRSYPPSLSTSDPLIVSPFLLYNHLALLSPLLSPLSSLLSIRASSLSSPINSPTPLILVIFVILGFSRLFSIIHPSMIRSSR